MKCKKQCKCQECEMYDGKSTITIVDDRNPFNSHQTVRRAIHCSYHGGYALTTEEEKLKKGGRWKDDYIFTSENKNIKFDGYNLIIEEV